MTAKPCLWALVQTLPRMILFISLPILTMPMQLCLQVRRLATSRFSQTSKPPIRALQVTWDGIAFLAMTLAFALRIVMLRADVLDSTSTSSVILPSMWVQNVLTHLVPLSLSVHTGEHV